MPFLERGDVSIYYEEYGAGFPLLLFAPGSLQSGIDWWANEAAAPFDPRQEFANDFRVIAMDQRNAGESRAPITADDGWHSYAEDQIALLDHLGIETAHILGACIGVSFCLRLMQDVPGRVAAGVLQQPIGREDDDAPPTTHQVQRLLDSLPPDSRPSPDVADAFSWNMYAPPFVYSVSREFVARCRHPLLVLPGEDKAHPRAVALEIARTAPKAELVDKWREDVPATVQRVRQFLKTHTPA